MSLRRVPMVGLAIVAMLVAGWAVAHAVAQAEKSKPIVTVTKADNTTVRGRLLEYDPDQIKVEIGAKPGEGEVVVIEWAQVSKVSTGLTRAKALAEWKTVHAADLCETCHGNRTSRCADCRGTGHEHAASKDCPKCKGEGEIQCTQPRCKEGKQPCAGKCIKLSEGQWVKGDEGKRWRTIKIGTGTLKLSEAHVGEVWEVENGQPVNRGKCPACQGTTEISCPKCEGAAKVACPTCLAKAGAPDCPTCEAGQVACVTCAGSGLKAK